MKASYKLATISTISLLLNSGHGCASALAKHRHRTHGHTPSKLEAVSIQADLQSYSGAQLQAKIQVRAVRSLQKALALAKKDILEGEYKRAKVQTQHMGEALKNIVQTLGSKPMAGKNMAKASSQSSGSDGASVTAGTVNKDAKPQVGKGVTSEAEDADAEKEGDELQGGEDDAEHKETSNSIEDAFDVTGETTSDSFVKKSIKTLAEKSDKNSSEQPTVNFSRLAEIETQIQ